MQSTAYRRKIEECQVAGRLVVRIASSLAIASDRLGASYFSDQMNDKTLVHRCTHYVVNSLEMIIIGMLERHFSYVLTGCRSGHIAVLEAGLSRPLFV